MSGALLKVDTDRQTQLYAVLKRTPSVAGAAILSTKIAPMRDIMNRRSILMTTIMTAFGVVLVVGVVHNSARITLSERDNELASLRVPGFTRGEVTQLLLAEQPIVTSAAIPVGCSLGALACRLLVPLFDRGLLRMPFELSGSTFGFSSLVALGAAALTGALVDERITRLDLIAVLKTRE